MQTMLRPPNLLRRGRNNPDQPEASTLISASHSLSHAAAANFVRGELARYLRQKPYYVDSLIGGWDKEAGPSLYYLDYLVSFLHCNAWLFFVLVGAEWHAILIPYPSGLRTRYTLLMRLFSA